MKIIEDITYSIDDIAEQIRQTFGFEYISADDNEGYIVLSSQVELELVFNEQERKLDSALVRLPTNTMDLTDNTVAADTYTSSIESAVQIIDLIKRMLGSGGEKE